MKEADAGVTVPEKRKGKKADKLSDAGVAVGAVVDGGDMARSVDENCADCGKLVLSNHSAIKCDGCGFWHHIACEGITDDVYSFLCDHETVDSIHWFCRHCNVIFRRMHSEVVRLDGAQKRLEEKVDSIMSRLDKSRNETQVVQQSISVAVKEQLQEDREEELELDKRKSNVMIHGVAESSSENADDRIEDDRGQMASMFQVLDCDVIQANKIIRLGKKPQQSNEKPRPILLVLDTEEHKKKLLEQAKNLKNRKEGGWDKVYIHQDLTPKQREQRKIVVAELKKRQAAGEPNLIIVNNKITKRR
jgi:hypothetical protein